MDRSKVSETSKILEFKRPDLNEMRSFLQDDLFNDDIIEKILREFETDIGPELSGPESRKAPSSQQMQLEKKWERLEQAVERIEFYLEEISLHHNLD